MIRRDDMKPATRCSAPAHYSEDEIRIIRTRGKARRLTQLCVACEDLSHCSLGRLLDRLHRECCRPEIGDEFRRCAGCSRTLRDDCVIDMADLSKPLHDQLAVCTAKRGFNLPLNLLRLDVLLGEHGNVKPPGCAGRPNDRSLKSTSHSEYLS